MDGDDVDGEAKGMEVEVGLRGAGRFNHQSCHITAQPQLSRWGLERCATSPFCFFRANLSLDCVHAYS